MSLVQCHFDYACSFWYPGLSKLLKMKKKQQKNYKLHKTKLSDLFYDFIQGRILELMNSNHLNGYQCLEELIKSSQITFLKLILVNMQIIRLSILFQQV